MGYCIPYLQLATNVSAVPGFSYEVLRGKRLAGLFKGYWRIEVKAQAHGEGLMWREVIGRVPEGMTTACVVAKETSNPMRRVNFLTVFKEQK